MLPCGTPCESRNVSDKVDPTRTWIDLQGSFQKNLLIWPLLQARVDHVKFHTSKWYRMLFPSQKHSDNMFLFNKGITYKGFQSNQIIIGTSFRTETGLNERNKMVNF